MLRICGFFFFKQKTAYGMRISDWSSDVCSSDLALQQSRGYAAPHKYRQSLPDTPQEPTMYQDFNEQFANATRQFADTATQANRLATENAEKVFGLQLDTFEENANAAFAFWGEVAQVRDFDDMKAALPKGAQDER